MTNDEYGSIEFYVYSSSIQSKKMEHINDPFMKSDKLNRSMKKSEAGKPVSHHSTGSSTSKISNKNNSENF